MPRPVSIRIRSPHCLLGDAVELVPDRLRQAGAREEEHPDPAEEGLAQRRVDLERVGDLLEALRHVEVDRRRDLAQVAQRLADQRRRRLAFVDVERAAVVERRGRRCGCRRRCGSTAASRPAPAAPRPACGKHWRIICWFAHSMRCVLITPFGSLVEPDVNRNLAIVSGPTLRVRRRRPRRSARSRAASSNGDRRRARRARPWPRTTGVSARHHRLDRLAVRRPAREHQARRQHAEDVAQLAVVLRDQRIRRRDRRERHAGEHRAEREQEVLDVVVGQDRDRPLGRELAIEQRLRDRARARAAPRRS